MHELSLRATNAATQVVLAWAPKPPATDVISLIAFILNRPSGLPCIYNLSDHPLADPIQYFLNSDSDYLICLSKGTLLGFGVPVQAGGFGADLSHAAQKKAGDTIVDLHIHRRLGEMTVSAFLLVGGYEVVPAAQRSV